MYLKSEGFGNGSCETGRDNESQILWAILESDVSSLVHGTKGFACRLSLEIPTSRLRSDRLARFVLLKTPNVGLEIHCQSTQPFTIQVKLTFTQTIFTSNIIMVNAFQIYIS